MKTRLARPVFAAIALAFAAALLSVLGADSPPAATTPKPAAPALPIVRQSPDWKLTDLEGKQIGSDTLRGKVVVIDFWATWCPPCVHEIPGYIALQKKYADKGLVIVGLSLDSKGADVVAPFAIKKGINYPLAIADSTLTDAFGGVEGIPTTFLIDREGNIRHKKVGSMDAEEYEKLVAPLL